MRVLGRPAYELEAQPGTRIRNGHTIRRYCLELGAAVSEARSAGRIPVVIGGDCSILLGCLWGVRCDGARCGLLHIDGHSDFFHPGNYDVLSRLGSVAGMDLALATGRGETLLTRWPGVIGPLVEDADVVQLGERDELAPDYAYRDIEDSRIHRLTVRSVKRMGVPRAAEEVGDYLLRRRRLDCIWLHIDVDVLDQTVMPAVDSPGSPGLDFSELEALVESVCRSMPVAGVDITVFDPDLDPDGRYARALAHCLANALSALSDGGIERNTR